MFPGITVLSQLYNLLTEENRRNTAISLVVDTNVVERDNLYPSFAEPVSDLLQCLV
jgi:hypothetical protein